MVETQTRLEEFSSEEIHRELRRRECAKEFVEKEESFSNGYKIFLRRGPCAMVGRAYLPHLITEKSMKNAIPQERTLVSFRIEGNMAWYKSWGPKMTRGVWKYFSNHLSRTDEKALYEEMWLVVEKYVQDLFSSPAHIANMLSTCDNLYYTDDVLAEWSETKVEIYFDMRENFNAAIVDRFAEFSNEEIIQAIVKLKIDDFFTEGQAIGYLCYVLQERGLDVKQDENTWSSWFIEGKPISELVKEFKEE